MSSPPEGIGEPLRPQRAIVKRRKVKHARWELANTGGGPLQRGMDVRVMVVMLPPHHTHLLLWALGPLASIRSPPCSSVHSGVRRTPAFPKLPSTGTRAPPFLALCTSTNAPLAAGLPQADTNCSVTAPRGCSSAPFPGGLVAVDVITVSILIIVVALVPTADTTDSHQRFCGGLIRHPAAIAADMSGLVLGGRLG